MCIICDDGAHVQGVLDLGGRKPKVTHAHCPAAPWENTAHLGATEPDSGGAHQLPSWAERAPNAHPRCVRRGAWLASSGTFCVSAYAP
eukprot:6232237-Pyramimonas_sp.AAC.1